MSSTRLLPFDIICHSTRRHFSRTCKSDFWICSDWCATSQPHENLRKRQMQLSCRSDCLSHQVRCLCLLNTRVPSCPLWIGRIWASEPLSIRQVPCEPWKATNKLVKSRSDNHSNKIQNMIGLFIKLQAPAPYFTVGFFEKIMLSDCPNLLICHTTNSTILLRRNVPRQMFLQRAYVLAMHLRYLHPTWGTPNIGNAPFAYWCWWQRLVKIWGRQPDYKRNVRPTLHWNAEE